MMLILWFKNDLRLEDNPAFCSAIKEGLPLCPLYVFSPNEGKDVSMGAASKWWLHFALKDLGEQLAKYHLKLILRTGKPLEVICDIAKKNKVKAVFWNRNYEPYAIKRDEQIKKALSSSGILAKSFKSHVLFEPHTIKNKSGKPFQVFTPFWKQCLSLGYEAKICRPDYKNIQSSGRWPSSEPLKTLGLLPIIPWDIGLREGWCPTSASAKQKLNQFIKNNLADYNTNRDHPAVDGTSSLSPYLHFGQISPSYVWSEVTSSLNASNTGLKTFLAEIGWREFAYHLLYHFPETPQKPLHKEFASFPWKENKQAMHAWQSGQTGYPIVDAGMRQLWQTGWMHNRVRMIVGSFLVKHLLQPWQKGAAWFWDTLVDADLASNTLGWQWVSGCGADASPYFRIFNPVLQGEKFDAKGDYVRRYLPKLSQLPAKWVHKPWEAPQEVLDGAGIYLGKNYPRPIIGLQEGRSRALKAYENFKAHS